MSSYRNYMPWNSPNNSSSGSYSSSGKKETTASIPKYDSSFGRSRTDASKKPDDDKSGSSRIASKYGGAYSGSYQRDNGTGYTPRTESSRIKPLLDKKDTSHPPVTYRPIVRTGSRSRDPSPIEKSEKSSSSSSYNYNRLYPKPYQNSVARDRSVSPSTTTIPRYTGRTSTGRDEIPKYTGRSSTSKDDIPRYTGRTSLTKDDISPRFKATSREDLSGGSQKYINSRFLPKNTVEKSYTAYTRPSTVRSNETSRKNRELLSVLHAQQEQERLSRPSSRCSSVAPDESASKSSEISLPKQSPPKEVELETITVVTRGTSPSPCSTNHSGSNLLRSRRIEIAKVVQKQITRPKRRVHTMLDKEVQSDRLDDTTKISRFAGASRIASAPWTSFLDMKFTGPNSKQHSPEIKNKECDSPKNLSRTNSSKSLSSKCDSPKEPKKPTKSKLATPKPVTDNKKQLPPQIPGKSNSSHSTSPANKDFRKSVLNMNPDGKKKKLGRRSNSGSSAESDQNDQDATDVSENLTTCNSYHGSSPSRLPQKQKNSSEKSSTRSRRSPSSEVSVASTTTSGSEDDVRTKKDRARGPSSSTASAVANEKAQKATQIPKIRNEGMKSEAEAKSFLMRALAPVTNLFKTKHQDVGEKNLPDPITEDDPEKVASPERIEPKSAKIIIHRVESGDRPWWLDPDNSEKSPQEQKPVNFQPEDNAKKPMLFRVESDEKPWWMDPERSDQDSNQERSPVATYIQIEEGKKPVIYRVESYDRTLNHAQDQNSSHSSPGATRSDKLSKKPVIRHFESGEIPWWLDENAEVPEGIETYPNWVREDGTTADGKVVYKIRKFDSDESSWWLSGSEKTNSDPKSRAVNIMDAEYLEKHKIRHIDSGERAWWLNSSENVSEPVKGNLDQTPKSKYAIRHQDSGERAWWLEDNQQHKDAENDFDYQQIPLGDRASPEGLEMPKDSEGRQSPYDNVPTPQVKLKRPSQLPLFISKHTNIDEILGGGTQIWSPFIDKYYGYESEEEKCQEIDPGQVIIHERGPQKIQKNSSRLENSGGYPATFSSQGKLDDAALQLYKDGDYGSYLDLEASISEQQEEFEGFQSNKKNSIVLRTQLSVRVHTIIEKLLTSEGRELRRSLFSLKQIFQEDKDLVHEFVQNDGLSCLIKVGSEADQNYQNYILRALGQVMLYVDGMNGVMEHNQTVQWLYSLISSKFRLVVKTALKLLLVFIEYTDSNCTLLIKAIHTVDYSQGGLPFHNIMKLLKDFDSADTELLIYAMTLINKILNGIPDQDTYYDQTDALEEQGMETIIQRYMSKPGTDLDLLQQFQIYEAVLQYEDGEENVSGTPFRHLDESIRKTIRNRKSVVDTIERRKSRRHSTGNTPAVHSNNNRNINAQLQTNKEDDDESSSSQSSGINNSHLNGGYKENNKAFDAGVTPALKRRRERAERQRSFMKEQESSAFFRGCLLHEENHENENGNFSSNGFQQRISNGNAPNRNSGRKDLTPLMNAVNKLDSEDKQPPWIFSMIENEGKLEESDVGNENERNVLLQLKRENTVKDLTQKLANQNMLQTPTDESKMNRIGDMSGLISKAKEGLAKSKSKVDVLKSPTGDCGQKAEAKKSENELRWEELVASMNRSLNLCDMDFTDLASEDEVDILAPAMVTNGIPPPPPPLAEMGNAPPPPPLSNRIAPPSAPSPPIFGINLQRQNKPTETKIPIKKNKKTVKLFWKEVRDDPISHVKLKSGYIWDELNPVTVDTQKLEHLFESRAKDLITKKQQEMNKNKEIIVLDPKRSNAINIGMTKLPPPRSIKTAILKMDATIMNREGIEKLLTMLPTEEERTKIQDAQAANPDLPLGSAEQFLLTLASISELPARLKLWAFKLDFENAEREIAEPLMDLKQGFEVLKINKTFRGILSTLLSIGNFLNGNEVKGFQIEYLAKVPEVKDTVHKHSLLHHLCHIVMEKFPDATDLYSEIGAITRASKVDFDELSQNIQRLESDCKASWDHLKLIAKHDGSTMMKVKMSDFLADCAERIIILGVIHRRIINRFHKFLLWIGIPLHQIADTKPNEFCRVISEFALEYRTTRERVLQQLEKKANHRERNKTRGKMITDMGKFKTKEDRADAELRQLLGSDMSDVESLQGTLPWRRTRRDGNRSFLNPSNGNLTDGDDEILESLVKTATKGPSTRTAPRERKRTRHADRKSLRRTLKNGLSEEEKKHLSAYIKGY